MNVSLIDEYIDKFPPEIQVNLNAIKSIIREVVPPTTIEKISWQMPTFYLNGNLVHFAGHKKHIGFYPGDVAIECFKDRLAGLKYSKGAIQFDYDKPLPKSLIQEIIAFRVKQQMNK